MDKGTQASGEIAKDRVKGFFPSMDKQLPKAFGNPTNCPKERLRLNFTKANTKMDIYMAKESIDSWMEVSIEENGATTRKTGKEYITTQMETHTKVILLTESNKVKECTNMQPDNIMKGSINLT